MDNYCLLDTISYIKQLETYRSNTMTRYTDYFKGRLLRELPDDYTIVDIETTGLDPNTGVTEK